jgi:Domain of unknown function DUF1828
MPQIDYILGHLTRLPCRELLIASLGTVDGTTVRIETTLMRSNGNYVDVFVDTGGDSDDWVTLTDFGTTWDYLFDSDKSPIRSSMQYLAESYGLRLSGQALSISCRARDILPCLLKLGQACVAMSYPGPFANLPTMAAVHERAAVSSPARKPSTLSTVVDILTRSKVSFNQSVNIHLRDEHQVQVDILARAPNRLAALMVIQHSPYMKVTMGRADHAFAVHADLKEGEWRGDRISVLDDDDFDKLDEVDSFVRLGRISKLVNTASVKNLALTTQE